MRRQSMRRWLLLQFILIVILPSLLIFLVSSLISVRAAMDQQVRSTSLILEEIRQNIDTKLKFLQQMTVQFYLNDAAMAELLSSTPVGECRWIQSQLDSYVNSNPYIQNAYLYTDRGIIESGHGITNMDEVNESVQGRLAGLEGRISWHFVGTVKSLFGMEQNGIFGSRHIRKDMKPVATLHLGLREAIFFGDFFSSVQTDERQPIVVCNPDGVVIASTGRSYPPGSRLFLGQTLEEIRRGPQPYAYRTDVGEQLVLTTASTESGWVIATFFSRRKILDDIRPIWVLFYAAIPLFAIFLFSLSIVLTRRFSRPLSDLSATLASVGSDLREIPVDTSETREVQMLSESYNAMTRRIRDLMQKVRQREKERRRAHLQTLQLQLTPHFLYNALDTIGWLARMNGQENIRDITRALVAFLKEVSAIDSGFITLGRELDLLSDFAVIQRYRYTDFELALEVPEELRGLYVHKMMLVNLMENSVTHGFRDHREGNAITVRAERTNSRLVIHFADNGAGFDPAELKRARGTPSASIGLRNTRKRIKLYHGPGSGLKIDSAVGAGCRIVISIPVMREPPE